MTSESDREGLDAESPNDLSVELRRTYEIVTARLFDRTPRAITIDRYVVLRTLGAGGMGRVYLAHDPVLDREVAIKLIATEGDAHARQLRRDALLNEARALAKLGDPNVVAIYGGGAIDGDVYIAMEHVAGGTLEPWVDAGPHPYADAIRRLVPAGRGLAASHGRGVIHRDFKPSNVLVTTDGVLKVADFGLAHSGERARGLATNEGSGETPAVEGTPAYMAPEQREGLPIDARADQYAFCVVLFEALYGRRPDQPAARARGRPQPIPRAVANALARGLAKDPRDRFATMSALLDALERGASRSRRSLWPLATLGVAGVGIAIAAAGGRDAPVCDGAAELATAWNDGRRAAAVATVTRIGRDVAPNLTDDLDAYAGSWLAAHATACEAKGDPDGLFDQRMACLDERRRAFGALTDVLHDADAPVLAAAAEASATLPAIDACADAAALQRRVAEPIDPRVVREVAALREELAHAQAWLAAGRPEEAAAILAEIEPRARATDYPPIVVEIVALAGHAADDRGAYSLAHERLAEAYPLAVANGQDDLATRLAIDLVFATGERLALHDEAQRWARQARVWLDRTAQADTVLAADLHSNLGTTAYREGDYRAARTEHVRALALREAVRPVVEPPIARSLTNLGLADAALGDLEPATANHRRALAMLETRLGTEHPTVAEVHVNLAATLDLAGAHAEAITHLDHAAAIQRRMLGPAHPRYAATLESLAVSHRGLGDGATAVDLLEQALAIRSETLGPDHPDVAITLVNLAVLDDEAGDHAGAILRNDQAIFALRRAFGSDHPHIMTALHNQALAHGELDQLELAESRLLAAIELGEAQLGPDHPLVAGAIDDHGAILLRRGQPERALALHRRALASYEASFGGEHEDVVLTLAHLGAAELALGEIDAAHDHFTRAVAIGEQVWGATDPRLVRSLLGVARVAIERGDRAAALRSAERAATLSADHAEVVAMLNELRGA